MTNLHGTVHNLSQMTLFSSADAAIAGPLIPVLQALQPKRSHKGGLTFNLGLVLFMTGNGLLQLTLGALQLVNQAV